jgi:hypothetical protein
MALLGGKINLSTATLIVIAAVLAVLLAMDALSRVDVVTDEAQLQGKLEYVRLAVVEYSHAHKRAPADLSELGLKPEQLTDRLGGRMAYSVDRDRGQATLSGALRNNYLDTWKIVLEFPLAAAKQ